MKKQIISLAISTVICSSSTAFAMMSNLSNEEWGARERVQQWTETKSIRPNLPTLEESAKVRRFIDQNNLRPEEEKLKSLLTSRDFVAENMSERFKWTIPKELWGALINPYPEDDLNPLLYTTPLTLDGENFNVDWRIVNLCNGYNNTGPIIAVSADGAGATYAGDILFYYRLSFDKKNDTQNQYKGRLGIQGYLSKQ